jgi:hypothetical protein
MFRVLQSLLALTSLLVLTFLAARVNGAPFSDGNTQWQSPPVAESAAAPCRRLCLHRLMPGPQAGTHLQAQPFAYGYFGAHAPTTAAFHRSARNDSYQWTFSRAD